MNKQKVHNYYLNELQEAINIKKKLINKKNDFFNIYKLFNSTIENKKKIIFAGNGGSASDAQHLATELTVRYKYNRKALSANYKIGDVLNGAVFDVRPDDKKIVLHVEGLAPDDGSRKDDIKEFLDNQDAPASEKIQIPDDLVKN